MLILQLSDPHIKIPGRLAYRKVDSTAMLRACVAQVRNLNPAPDLVVLTGDLVDFGRPEEYEHLKNLLRPLGWPLLVVPGNHDEREAMRQAFGAEGYFPASGFLHYAIERGPLRLIGLDTVIPGVGRGELCRERLTWLERALAAKPNLPTVIMMHHPPFLTGIAHMDRIGLEGRAEFASLVARYPQIQAILCGHLHRTIQTSVGGRRTTTCPSPAHQVALDLTPEGPSAFCLEPPGYLLHRWADGTLVSHTAVLGDHPGPFPFFEPDGTLID